MRKNMQNIQEELSSSKEQHSKILKILENEIKKYQDETTIEKTKVDSCLQKIQLLEESLNKLQDEKAVLIKSLEMKAEVANNLNSENSSEDCVKENEDLKSINKELTFDMKMRAALSKAQDKSKDKRKE